MRYVAKPVEIEAWFWTGNPEDLPASEWATGLYAMLPDGTLIIQTNEGPAKAIPHLYYAAIGTKNERYPIRRDVMAEKYSELT